MVTKKVTLRELKDIVKKIINEEMVKEKETFPKIDDKEKQKVVNQLTRVFGYSTKQAISLVDKYPNMNATAINKKEKDIK